MKCTAAEAETQRIRGWTGKSLSDDNAVCVCVCVVFKRNKRREENIRSLKIKHNKNESVGEEMKNNFNSMLKNKLRGNKWSRKRKYQTLKEEK